MMYETCITIGSAMVRTPHAAWTDQEMGHETGLRPAHSSYQAGSMFGEKP